MRRASRCGVSTAACRFFLLPIRLCQCWCCCPLRCACGWGQEAGVAWPWDSSSFTAGFEEVGHCETVSCCEMQFLPNCYRCKPRKTHPKQPLPRGKCQPAKESPKGKRQPSLPQAIAKKQMRQDARKQAKSQNRHSAWVLQPC